MSSNIEGWFPGGRCDPSVTPAKEIPDMHATSKLEVRIAEKFCAPCQVITPCYEEALADEKVEGIRGGKTSNERKAIRRYLKENPGTVAPPQPRA